MVLSAVWVAACIAPAWARAPSRARPPWRRARCDPCPPRRPPTARRARPAQRMECTPPHGQSVYAQVASTHPTQSIGHGPAQQAGEEQAETRLLVAASHPPAAPAPVVPRVPLLPAHRRRPPAAVAPAPGPRAARLPALAPAAAAAVVVLCQRPVLVVRVLRRAAVGCLGPLRGHRGLPALARRGSCGAGNTGETHAAVEQVVKQRTHHWATGQ